jgi:MFS family permease
MAILRTLQSLPFRGAIAAMVEYASAQPLRSPHPAALLVLYLPFGMSAGYVTVTLAYVLAHHGVSVAQIAGLVALQFLPQTWKFAWAPLVDTTLSAKRWYLIGALSTAVSMVAMGLITPRPGTLWLLSALVFLSSVASTFVAMATEVLMAHGTPESLRGSAGGWSQAGNLGGGGLGGGLALWMAQHVSDWSAGLAMGLIMVGCVLGLRCFREPERTREQHPGYLASLGDVGRNVWVIARSRAGYLTLLLFCIPIGTGAAGGLWSAVADDWHAGADLVAFVNGALSGLVSMAGCLIGGKLSDRMDRRTSYALFGLVQAAAAVAMAVMPKTPTSFVVWTMAYALFNGFVYAAYAAVVLEAIGTRSAATNWNLLASAANLPIWYMTLIEGSAQARWGSSGMLYTEAMLALGAVAVLALATAVTRPRTAPVAA